MKLLLIGVAFDSGHRDQRMGRGPGRLIDGGAVERLRQGGHDVEVAFAEPASRFTTEIGTAFELQRSVAAYVGRARAANAFPLILSGNCNTAAIGALAGLGASRPSLVWFDGHADFCTPETAEMGFLDGMGLAMATGRCWTRMTSIVPGFQPVPDELALLVGAHDIEAREGDDLRRSGIVHVPVERLRHGVDDPALAHALAHVRTRTDATYLHIDLDVHDPSLARANHLAPDGGLTPGEVRAAVRAVATALPVQAASLTAYDPDCDPAGRMIGVALDLMADLVEVIAATRW